MTDTAIFLCNTAQTAQVEGVTHYYYTIGAYNIDIGTADADTFTWVYGTHRGTGRVVARKAGKVLMHWLMPDSVKAIVEAQAEFMGHSFADVTIRALQDLGSMVIAAGGTLPLSAQIVRYCMTVLQDDGEGGTEYARLENADADRYIQAFYPHVFSGLDFENVK